jgi:pimeloyl-ACP methyl ester carboxylesterase
MVPAIVRLFPRQAMLRQSAQAASVSEPVRAYVHEAMSRLDDAELVTVLRESFACMRPSPGYRIPRPFLLVRGAESRNAAIAEEGPRWAAREPNCRRDVCIAGAGHTVNMDQPEAFNREVLAFLADLP